MKRWKLFLGFLMASAVFALIAAACGGDEGSPAPTNTRPPAPTAAPTNTRPPATVPPATTAPAPTTPPATGGAGDPVAGQSVFSSKGCGACHSTGSNQIVGPGLGGIATRAATRKPGLDAKGYIEESILQPNAFVVQGFPAGVMPTLFNSAGDEGFADLVAYLLTLR